MHCVRGGPSGHVGPGERGGGGGWSHKAHELPDDGPTRVVLVDKNLNATANCLVIAADFVTLDLGGFVLTGNGSGEGVSDPFPGHKGVVVRNGTVTNFQTGIFLAGVGSRVEGVQAISNTGEGIATFFVGIVTGSMAISNGGAGISIGNGVVTGNSAIANGADGIFVFCPSNIIGNTAVRNTGSMNLTGC